MFYCFIFALLMTFVAETFCTTEWFGDLRAHLNPPRSPPFYDIVYDDSDCPFGMESIAIPEYVYFGEMIATKSVRDHSVCLQSCIESSRCKAVNYFESLGKKNHQEMGFCELLVETQYDNPRLMRPFRKATYYEKIRCRISEEEEEPFEFDKNGKEGKELLLTNGELAEKDWREKITIPPSDNIKKINEQKQDGGGLKITENGGKGMTSLPASDDLINPRLNREKETTLKKLAQKVHEFNLRFRS